MEWEPARYGGQGGWWGECFCWGWGVPLQAWTLLVLLQGQTRSAVCWHMVLKACELLCLLDPALPALSVSSHFSPFLSFSPWEGGHSYGHGTGPRAQFVTGSWTPCLLPGTLS